MGKRSITVADRPAIRIGSKDAGLNQVRDEKLFWLPSDQLNLLKPDTGNRVSITNHNHVRRIGDSIKLHGFFRTEPLIVGEDMVIKDGHHRFLAAQEVKSGVWYKIDTEFDLATIARVQNIFKKWTNEDWINKYANEGNEEYVRIRDFMNKYGMGFKVALAIFEDKANQPSQQQFEAAAVAEGKFKVSDWSKAEWKANAIQAFAPYLPNPKECWHICFAMAVLRCLKTKKYNHQQMLHKASLQTKRLAVQRTRKENLQMLQDIYNYMRSTNEKLVFV